MNVYIVEADEEEKTRICDVLAHRVLNTQWFTTGNEFLNACDDLPAGVVIVDICLPDLDGLALLRKVRRECEASHQIILLSGPCDVCDVVRAMREGAIDFFEKPFRRAEMLDAVNRAELKIEEDRHEKRVGTTPTLAFNELTKREAEILHASADGTCAKQVAYELNLSVRTVEMHRSNIIKKLNVNNFAAALVLAAASAH